MWGPWVIITYLTLPSRLHLLHLPPFMPCSRCTCSWAFREAEKGAWGRTHAAAASRALPSFLPSGQFCVNLTSFLLGHSFSLLVSEIFSKILLVVLYCLFSCTWHILPPKRGSIIFGIQQVPDKMIRFVSFVSLNLELADLLQTSLKGCFKMMFSTNLEQFAPSLPDIPLSCHLSTYLSNLDVEFST